MDLFHWEKEGRTLTLGPFPPPFGAGRHTDSRDPVRHTSPERDPTVSLESDDRGRRGSGLDGRTEGNMGGRGTRRGRTGKNSGVYGEYRTRGIKDSESVEESTLYGDSDTCRDPWLKTSRVVSRHCGSLRRPRSQSAVSTLDLRTTGRGRETRSDRGQRLHEGKSECTTKRRILPVFLVLLLQSIFCPTPNTGPTNTGSF